MFPIRTDADIERTPVSYVAGDHIVTAGEVAPGLILILSGKVEIAATSFS